MISCICFSLILFSFLLHPSPSIHTEPSDSHMTDAILDIAYIRGKCVIRDCQRVRKGRILYGGYNIMRVGARGVFLVNILCFLPLGGFSTAALATSSSGIIREIITCYISIHPSPPLYISPSDYLLYPFIDSLR